MDGGWALILSAVVTAVGGVIVTVIAQFRKENRTDHNDVMSVLRIMYKGIGRVETKVDKVDGRLTNHLISHATEGLDNGRRTDKNRVEGDTEVSE
jgi:hypothetical protein